MLVEALIEVFSGMLSALTGVSKNVITAQPTISAQSWASLLHGVTPDKHWSTNYDAGLYSYSRDLYPSVLKVLTTINPNYNVGSIARWNSINVGIVEDNAGFNQLKLSKACVAGVEYDRRIVEGERSSIT